MRARLSIVTYVLTASIALAAYNDVTGRSPASNNTVSNLTVYGTVALTNTTWEDLTFPANLGVRGQALTYDADSNAVKFANTCSTNNIDEEIYGIAQMRHRYKLASAVHPHVHFIQTDSNQTNNWYLYISFRDLASTNEIRWTKYGPSSNELPFVGNRMHQYSEFPAIDNNSMTGLSALIDWRLSRDGDNDTFNGDLYLKAFDIHYEIDSLGSADELTK